MESSVDYTQRLGNHQTNHDEQSNKISILNITVFRFCFVSIPDDMTRQSIEHFLSIELAKTFSALLLQLKCNSK